MASLKTVGVVQGPAEADVNPALVVTYFGGKEAPPHGTGEWI